MRLRAGKRHGAGSTAGCVLGDDQTFLGDPSRQLRMCGRVVAIDAAAEDGDRRPARLERAAMRLGVDAAREAGDDEEARARKLAAEHARDGGAVARAGTRADDRDSRARRERRIGVSAQEKAGRRIVDRVQKRGERRCRAGEEAEAGGGEPLLVGTRVEGAHVHEIATIDRRATRCVPVSDA